MHVTRLQSFNKNENCKKYGHFNDVKAQKHVNINPQVNA
jgi:hypothetical protein